MIFAKFRDDESERKNAHGFARVLTRMAMYGNKKERKWCRNERETSEKRRKVKSDGMEGWYLSSFLESGVIR